MVSDIIDTIIRPLYFVRRISDVLLKRARKISNAFTIRGDYLNERTWKFMASLETRAGTSE